MEFVPVSDGDGLAFMLKLDLVDCAPLYFSKGIAKPPPELFILLSLYNLKDSLFSF